jgi:hypothetical protein
LIQLTPVEFLNVADLRANFDERCPPEKRSVVPADGVLTSYRDFECTNPTPALEIPDVGVSDVEPRFFLNSYHLAPEALDQLAVHSSHAIIFGVPVNLVLRNALQAARFPASSACNPANRHYHDPVEQPPEAVVPKGETETCMPSLSRSQLAGIFSGVLTQWSQIVNPQGYALAQRSEPNGPIKSPPGVRPPSDDKVYVCRRVGTSGTQAAYEMFFLNQRCASGVRPFVEGESHVFLGSVTSDVKACLTNLDDRGMWAVGIMSTDNVESLAQDRWRFLKMDGVAPTLANAFSGRWPLFVEQSYQWRGAHSERPLQGLKLSLMAHLGMQLADVRVTRDLNRGFTHPWGSAGLMALSDSNLESLPRPAPGRPVTPAMIDQDPVLAVRHESGNCGPVVAAHPTELP